MFINTDFDQVRDYAPTTPGLAIDMAVAMESGVVFDTGTIGESNDIDDPNSIRCRVNDAFEALDAQRHLFNRASQVKAAEAAAVNPSKGEGE